MSNSGSTIGVMNLMALAASAIRDATRNIQWASNCSGKAH